ncbi:peroxiredoxin-like family protein [Melioribacteraceae bacterium 4301-Me]|uniref:peroxiredoxin-like family protein n=1 Tax=Pyranulibacter aquaticus TaxID=3163344 RepID=UPI0035963462
MNIKYFASITCLIISGIIMAQGNNNVANSAEEVCPIKISSEIPDVTVHNLSGEEIPIKEITKNKKSIIIFYRGGWCPFCNMHLSDLQTIEDDLVKIGYKLIAISMDKPENLKASIEKHNLKYELYSDSKAAACKAFGIAFKASDEYVNKLKNFNMDLEASSGEKHHILPVPSVFLVDENGIIKFEYVNPNYKERIKAKMLLEIAKNYL